MAGGLRLRLAELAIVGLMGCGCGSGMAQAGALAPATAAVLTEMAGHAAVIFAGTVETVARNDSAGFVDVRFRIDVPVRGCPRTGEYVLREWAGLWGGAGSAAGGERYRAGQRLLLLLAARGPGGMSAPVYGGGGAMDGAIPIVAASAGPVRDTQGNVPADPGVALASAVDLKWVQTRVLRAGYLPGKTGEASWTPVPPLSSAPGAALVSLDSVLGLLKGGLGGGVGGTQHAAQ